MTWTFFLQMLSVIAVVASASVVVVASGRRTYVDVLQKTSEGWRALADQRSAQIKNIESQLQEVRQELSQARSQLQEVSMLYVQSQQENRELKDRLTAAERNISNDRTAARRRRAVPDD